MQHRYTLAMTSSQRSVNNASVHNDYDDDDDYDGDGSGGGGISVNIRSTDYATVTRSVSLQPRIDAYDLLRG